MTSYIKLTSDLNLLNRRHVTEGVVECRVHEVIIAETLKLLVVILLKYLLKIRHLVGTTNTGRDGLGRAKKNQRLSLSSC